MQIRPRIEPEAKVLVRRKEIIHSRLIKIKSETKSKARCLSTKEEDDAIKANGSWT